MIWVSFRSVTLTVDSLVIGSLSGLSDSPRWHQAVWLLLRWCKASIYRELTKNLREIIKFAKHLFKTYAFTNDLLELNEVVVKGSLKTFLAEFEWRNLHSAVYLWTFKWMPWTCSGWVNAETSQTLWLWQRSWWGISWNNTIIYFYISIYITYKSSEYWTS